MWIGWPLRKTNGDSDNPDGNRLVEKKVLTRSLEEKRTWIEQDHEISVARQCEGVVPKLVRLGKGPPITLSDLLHGVQLISVEGSG